MRLRINPAALLGRLVALLLLTYLAWSWIAPVYVKALAASARAAVWLTERSSDARWRDATTIITRENNIFYQHRGFNAFHPPISPQGIPGDWIMSNMVLLIALMLATPAPTWKAKGVRFAVAMIVVMILQTLDILVAIKVMYANTFRGYWSLTAKKSYEFIDTFFQSFDALLFPFAIWAGIHFRDLLGDRLKNPSTAASTASEPKRTRSGRRR